MEFSGQIGRRGAAIVSQRGDKDKTKLCYARLPAQNSLQRFSEPKQDATLRP
jgi:hypothetical protein